MVLRGLFTLLFVILQMLPTAAVHADISPLAGSIEANLDGQKVVLAALSSNYKIAVRGDLVEVELKQIFENPYDKPLNARYLFPLNRDAAVHAMTMFVGNEVIEAEIQELAQAQKTFTQAKQAGKAAALLEQHRPNMFTQQVANPMPGVPITVVIKYAHVVPKKDAAFELIVPLVVGPRFSPAGSGSAPTDEDHQGALPRDPETWMLEKLPDYAPTRGVDLPATLDGRVSLILDLETPLPLTAVSSDTHPLQIRDISSTQQEIMFAQGKVLDNKDFVLRYAMAGANTAAGVLSHWHGDEGGYFSLLIQPPAQPAPASILPREMVFLLDCSGSMSGLPMAASKRFMTQALNGLRPNDTFRIIRFSDAATEFSQSPLSATPENIAAGLAYTTSLYGSGGTMMTSGITQALAVPAPEGVVRNVVFLTDGYIGNEVSVLSLVEQLRGDARLFAFGVGAGVNRYLMDELGRVGRGFTRYFDPTQDTESMEAVAAALAARLQSPVLTDLQIDWGDLPVSHVLPAVLPDLYAGDTLRVSGRFSQPGEGVIKITGRGNEHLAELTKQVGFSDQDFRPVVRRVWARTAVADLMHQFVTPVGRSEAGARREQLQDAVTELGLTYGLSTRWTAFVAVSRRVYNPDVSASLAAEVPLSKVAGVSNLAYTQPAMAGFGAPEPGLLLGLLVALATIVGFGRYWRRTPV